MEKSESISVIAAAMVKVQATVMGAKKDAFNPHHKSKYADLASVWDACREALTANGVSVIQSPEFAAGVVSVTTTLLHASGEFLSSTLGIPLGEKATAQTVGSAITYGRRYGLAAMVGIAPEDDDGESAEGRVSTPQRAPERHEPAPRAAQGDPKLLADLRVSSTKGVRPGDSEAANAWWQANYAAISRLSGDEKKHLQSHITAICDAPSTPAAPAQTNGNGRRAEMRP